MVQEKEFKGYIHDVGGPTADFRGPACKKQLTKGACPNRNCLFPEPCKNMVADHRDYVKLLRELKDIPGVKKVFIRSGIRFDYVLADKKKDFLRPDVPFRAGKGSRQRSAPRCAGARFEPCAFLYGKTAPRSISGIYPPLRCVQQKDGEAAVRTSVFYVVPSGV